MNSIDLMQNSIAYGLNALQENKLTFDSFSCLVKLKLSGKRQPLFLVHPVGGTVFCYKELVGYLENEHPVMAIQDPLLESNQVIFSNIEEIAQYYLQAIKSVQSDGHYLIGGYSFGANVAFEIAHQLEQQGKTLSLFMIDGWARYSERVYDHKLMMQITERVDSQMPNLIQDKHKFIDLLLKRVDMVFHYTYVPRKLKSKIIVFKACEILPQYVVADDATNGWQEYAECPVTTHVIFGTHVNLLRGEGPKQIAQILNNYLVQLDWLLGDKTRFITVP